MPSYLGKYQGAAKDREKKLRRAINSVVNQSYPNWELIIVADGCQKTVGIVKSYKDPRIKGFLIPKQAKWDGTQRNAGIYKSTKDWIIYLDTDDLYEPDYLENLNKEMTTHDWYYVDDIYYEPIGKKWFRNNTSLEFTRCGTSSIIHKRSLGVFWARGNTYAHDWVFISRLMKFDNFAKLNALGYKVMHVPFKYDL